MFGVAWRTGRPCFGCCVYWQNLRVFGQLHCIGVDRAYTGTRVLILVQDLNTSGSSTPSPGELARELTLDPHKKTTNPPAPLRTPNEKRPENLVLLFCATTSRSAVALA